MQKRGVVRGGTKSCFGRVGGGCRYRINLAAETQLFDNLAPFPRLRKNAQSYMTHFGKPLPGTVPPESGGRASPFSGASRLPSAYPVKLVQPVSYTIC